jgi:hypothetical protein
LIVNIRQSTASPVAKDQGNMEILGRVVSKTVKFACFTENRNAVWAGRQQLRKASYPYAMITFSANRKAFQLKVGEVFRFSYAPYNISNMVCRVLLKEEESIESESIKITAMEDIFSVALAVEEYTDPDDFTQPGVNFGALPFLIVDAFEAPFALREDLEVVPLAVRRSLNDMGALVHLSIDGGASYFLLNEVGNIQPYGTLAVAAYSADTYPLDEGPGFYVDFADADEAAKIETVSWADVFSAAKNNALMGNEIITFKTFTPVTATRYLVSDIVRGRFDTYRMDHAVGEVFWFIGSNIESVKDAEITPGVTRQFKLVPYNARTAGDVAEAEAVSLALTGRAYTPYIPSNFCANGSSFAARYTDDIVLTWSARYRGGGAGLGIPGDILASSSIEGLFRVEVYVGGSLVRTEVALDVTTWTYTEAMNLSDNGHLPSEVIFKLSNYRDLESGEFYESAQAEVHCKSVFGSLS